MPDGPPSSRPTLSDDTLSDRTSDMTFDRRATVSGPILTFDISTLPRRHAERGSWRAMTELFAQAATAVRELPDTASDLERLQATFWALKAVESLHRQVRADAETHLRRLAA